MKPVIYIQGVMAELRKVSWPSFQQVVRYFFSVVIGVALATVLIAGLDYIFINGLKLLIKN